MPTDQTTFEKFVTFWIPRKNYGKPITIQRDSLKAKIIDVDNQALHFKENLTLKIQYYDSNCFKLYLKNEADDNNDNKKLLLVLENFEQSSKGFFEFKLKYINEDCTDLTLEQVWDILHSKIYEIIKSFYQRDLYHPAIIFANLKIPLFDEPANLDNENCDAIQSYYLHLPIYFKSITKEAFDLSAFLNDINEWPLLSHNIKWQWKRVFSLKKPYQRIENQKNRKQIKDFLHMLDGYTSQECYINFLFDNCGNYSEERFNLTNSLIELSHLRQATIAKRDFLDLGFSIKVARYFFFGSLIVAALGIGISWSFGRKSKMDSSTSFSKNQQIIDNTDAIIESEKSIKMVLEEHFMSAMDSVRDETKRLNENQIIIIERLDSIMPFIFKADNQPVENSPQ